MDELETLKERMAAIEASDRLQVKQIKLVRAVNSGCIIAIAIVLMFILNTDQDSQSRQELRNLAIGVITAAASGVAMSSKLEVKE